MKGIDLRVTESGNYELDTNHEAVGKILVELSKVPSESRLGVARALLAASATYCFAGSLNFMLRTREVRVNSLTASSTLEMGKSESGKTVVKSIDIDVSVNVPKDMLGVLESCFKLAEDGCLITQSLNKGIIVNHEIKYIDKD